jgi:membrane protease YdiL (CAAX protease family)
VADRRPGWDRWHPAAALPLLLIVGPYYLNKFVYIAYPGDYVVFVATDYADKLFTLALLAVVARRQPGAFAVPWRFAMPTPPAWLLVGAGVAGLVVVDVLASPATEWLNDHVFRLTRYPDATGHPVLAVIDDSFGNLLTGLSEEAVFRFYLINVLLWRGRSPAAAAAISILVFAPIHWSYGLGNVAFAAVASVPLTLIYLATRNLAPPVAVHAAYDAVYFMGGVDALRRLVW